MRLNVSSSNTGSLDSDNSAAERDSGVGGLVATIFGLGTTAGWAATAAGLACGFATAAGGRGGPACGDTKVDWPATPCANADPALNATATPTIRVVRMLAPPGRVASNCAL